VQHCIIINIITITVGLSVPNPLFKVDLNNCKYPTAREASAADAISRVADEFYERPVLLNDFCITLYSRI